MKSSDRYFMSVISVAILFHTLGWIGLSFGYKCFGEVYHLRVQMTWMAALALYLLVDSFKNKH